MKIKIWLRKFIIIIGFCGSLFGWNFLLFTNTYWKWKLLNDLPYLILGEMLSGSPQLTKNAKEPVPTNDWWSKYQGKSRR